MVNKKQVLAGVAGVAAAVTGAAAAQASDLCQASPLLRLQPRRLATGQVSMVVYR